MGAIDDEQTFVDNAYAVLTEQVAALEQRMRAIHESPTTGTRQDELERQAQLDNLSQQWRAAVAAYTRLCVGRIDMADGQRFHIGRIGLRDDEGDPLLLDWRAPQAAGFYQATTLQPAGVAHRRRIIMRNRTVTHIEDEDLSDPTAASTDGAAYAMEAPREGRMGDIIATIAADQDAIIRSPLQQVTVVEGGPGTGKTVVALHRAAWLLYTYRERLAKDGVLVVGPSPAFLRYIEQVLPSLGETDVVLLTPAQLVPGITATAVDAPAVAAVKGDRRMAQVIANAVRARQRIPAHDVSIRLENGSLVTITAQQLEQARRAAPRHGSFHDGRDPFLLKALDFLARDQCRQRGDDPQDPEHRAQAVADLVTDRNVRRTLNLMWLPITPERLVRILLSDPDALQQATRGVLSSHETKILLRSPSDPWTSDDVPLIDEAAFRLGEYVPPRPAEASADVPELLAVDPYSSSAPSTTLAERALADREWVFGHVVVDEAQELSGMAWHCLARRSTRRSMTIVGDLQQATHPAGARNWDEALVGFGSNIHRHALTITYRITRQIAETAIHWLTLAGGDAPTLEPIRDGKPTTTIAVSADRLADTILSDLADVPGRACVILPDDAFDRLSATFLASEFGLGQYALDAEVAVLPVRDTKGLEFDTVFVVAPGQIATQGIRGSDVYVACTRATKRLVLVELTD